MGYIMYNSSVSFVKDKHAMNLPEKKIIHTTFNQPQTNPQPQEMWYFLNEQHVNRDWKSHWTHMRYTDQVSNIKYK